MTKSYYFYIVTERFSGMDYYINLYLILKSKNIESVKKAIVKRDYNSKAFLIEALSSFEAKTAIYEYLTPSLLKYSKAKILEVL